MLNRTSNDLRQTVFNRFIETEPEKAAQWMQTCKPSDLSMLQVHAKESGQLEMLAVLSAAFQMQKRESLGKMLANIGISPPASGKLFDRLLLKVPLTRRPTRSNDEGHRETIVEELINDGVKHYAISSPDAFISRPGERELRHLKSLIVDLSDSELHTLLANCSTSSLERLVRSSEQDELEQVLTNLSTSAIGHLSSVIWNRIHSLRQECANGLQNTFGFKSQLSREPFPVVPGSLTIKKALKLLLSQHAPKGQRVYVISCNGTYLGSARIQQLAYRSRYDAIESAIESRSFYFREEDPPSKMGAMLKRHDSRPIPVVDKKRRLASLITHSAASSYYSKIKRKRVLKKIIGFVH